MELFVLIFFFFFTFNSLIQKKKERKKWTKKDTYVEDKNNDHITYTLCTIQYIHYIPYSYRNINFFTLFGM